MPALHQIHLRPRSRTYLNGARCSVRFASSREKARPRSRSKQHLSELAFGKDAKADCYKVDRYDRDVCTVYVDGKDIGLLQLDAGLAWWYRKYAHEQLPRDRIDY
jgi:hypothetical protein